MFFQQTALFLIYTDDGIGYVIFGFLIEFACYTQSYHLATEKDSHVLLSHAFSMHSHSILTSVISALCFGYAQT